MPMPFYKIANVSCERFIITNLWPTQIELKKYLLFLDFFHTQDCAVGLSYLCLSFSLPHQKGVGQRTSTCLFLSLWTTSSSMKTNCVADRRNSEFWQRIGQPYMHKHLPMMEYYKQNNDHRSKQNQFCLNLLTPAKQTLPCQIVIAVIKGNGWQNNCSIRRGYLFQSILKIRNGQ